MPDSRLVRKALLAGAFLFALASAPAHGGIRCPADRIDLEARVEHVFDGDTVRLADDSRVRFIGINTPEHGRDGAPDEPLAGDATEALRALLAAQGHRIGLRFDEERRDRYGRLLAHVYLPDGRSIDRILLERGLGLHVTVPPNTRNHDCYAATEAAAREAGRGVWAHPRYHGIDTNELPADAAGFRVLRGTIHRVGESHDAWWLELDGLTLRLAKDDLAYFGDLDPQSLHGQRLRVRGWIYRVRGEARMNLRHPDAVEYLEPS